MQNMSFHSQRWESFETQAIDQEQKDPKSRLFHLYRQPMSSTAYLALFAKCYTSAKQGDDEAADSENTFAT